VKTLLYIGRFQPFHNGHLLAATQAQAQCDTLVFGLGSSDAEPSAKNPFSVSERREMIRSSMGNDSFLDFIHLRDCPGDDSHWVKQVHAEMAKYGNDWALFGFNKDASSFYLKLFPEHPLVQYSGVVVPINATDIRREYFRPDVDMEQIAQWVPSGTYRELKQIKEHDNGRWTLACKGAYL